MKKLHVHMSVNDLDQGIEFYSTLFGAKPTVHKTDYAKWDLDDPAVNFAISNRSQNVGINHLGIQTSSDDELEAIATRLESAEIAASKQEETACCYARSNKYWALDPTGMAWESFHSLGTVPIYGEDNDLSDQNGACCVPENVSVSCCS